MEQRPLLNERVNSGTRMSDPLHRTIVFQSCYRLRNGICYVLNEENACLTPLVSTENGSQRTRLLVKGQGLIGGDEKG